MALDYNAIFREMCDLPQSREGARKTAEKLREYIELRWPTVNDMSAADRKRLNKNPDRAVLITESKGADGRPVAVVTVRRPHAVAQQARTGFMSKAVRDVS